jgi:HNH endonuclease
MSYTKRPALPALTLDQIELLRTKIQRRSIVRPSGCRDWIGSRSSQMKYATIADPRRPAQPLYLHHATAEVNGKQKPNTPCPDGSHRWELHHICKNRVCVNPSHIIWVTSKQHVALYVQDRAELVARRKAQHKAAERETQQFLLENKAPQQVPTAGGAAMELEVA